jgi:hypothetical protein
MIEIVSFHLVEGADLDGFLAADATAQAEFAYAQPGLVRRTTARGEDGGWAVFTLWADLASANASAEAAPRDPNMAHLLSFIDRATFDVKRYVELEG